MTDDKRPANLAGMFIGGQVPFELVGLIFKAFYSAGINPSSFELAPIYTDANVAAAVEEMGRKLSANGAVPQITDQSAPKHKTRRPPGHGMKAYVLALINVGPRKKDDLRRLVRAKNQWNPNQLDARLHDLTKEKKIHRDADQVFHITNKGAASLSAKPAKRIFPKPKGAPTNVDFVLGLLQKAYPSSKTLQQLRTIFKAKGLRPESASVCLHVLKTRGQVEAPEPATYKFVPSHPSQETHSNVQPSQS